MSSDPTNPLIVVGVDGSPQAVDVLRWAVREAKATHGRVRAVLAWHLPQAADDLPFRVESEISEAAERLLDGVVGQVADGVPIETVVQEGSAVRLLLREAKAADLLVVGRHGEGHDGAKLVGSVAQTCMVQAPCPVVVVPMGEAT
jgi:nucleotide-binding universal stress UspA family protein